MIFIRKKRLRGMIVPVSGLSQQDKRRMFQLMDKYYSNVRKEDFERDLSAKDHVIVLRHPLTYMIEGFSTLKKLELSLNGGKVRGIFSGDTIIEKNFWGQQVLKQQFLRYLLAEKLRSPFRPLYWFLISKGYRTYLLMANNFRTHYPRYEKQTPTEIREILNASYRALYPRKFDASKGIIFPMVDDCRLRNGIAYPSAELRAKSPRVRFFEQSNPNWADGSELCCLAPMGFDLPFYYSYRICHKYLALFLKLFRRLSVVGASEKLGEAS